MHQECIEVEADKDIGRIQQILTPAGLATESPMAMEAKCHQKRSDKSQGGSLDNRQAHQAMEKEQPD
jgi:hypothetical protein